MALAKDLADKQGIELLIETLRGNVLDHALTHNILHCLQNTCASSVRNRLIIRQLGGMTKAATLPRHFGRHDAAKAAPQHPRAIGSAKRRGRSRSSSSPNRAR